MSDKLNEDFLYQVYSIVEEIPCGFVSTYGQIAMLMGHDHNSRMVGRALKMADLYGEFPCHRVVNSQGRLAPGWGEQRFLLEKENIPFKSNGYVDIKKCLWQI